MLSANGRHVANGPVRSWTTVNPVEGIRQGGGSCVEADNSNRAFGRKRRQVFSERESLPKGGQSNVIFEA